jgi:hypothetical protein
VSAEEVFGSALSSFRSGRNGRVSRHLGFPEFSDQPKFVREVDQLLCEFGIPQEVVLECLPVVFGFDRKRI